MSDFGRYWHEPTLALRGRRGTLGKRFAALQLLDYRRCKISIVQNDRNKNKRTIFNLTCRSIGTNNYDNVISVS